MVTDVFVQLLADRSGFTKWDIYKMLDELGNLIEKEVYEGGENISIGGLGSFKQAIIKNETSDEFKVLSFTPIPSMNNDSLKEWFKYQ